MITLLTVVVPAYNEEKNIEIVLERLHDAKSAYNIPKEIIVIDDCSTDGTKQQVEKFRDTHPDASILLISHDVNKGKGAALRTGIQQAKGDLVIVQDADLEYDPDEFDLLLKPFIKNVADVVYGSRFIGGNPRRLLFFWHSLGNKLLTNISNAFTNLNLTDMETGYKMFRREIIQSIRLEENRFGFEPEVTAKISRIPGIRVYEVGISYYGRTYKEGKKINWKDGFRAMYCILKYNIFRRGSHLSNKQ